MKGDSLDRLFAQNLAMVDIRLSRLAVNIFGRLLFYRNSQSGRCYPSQEKLAFDLGCTTRSVRKALRLLESTGYVRTERHWRGTRSNHYELLIPSGRAAYDKAEEMRFENRNEFSRKQSKENKNKKKKISGNTGRFRTSGRAEPERRKVAKKIEGLTADVVHRLGGGSKAWEGAMSIEADAREEIEQLYLEGKIDLRTAAANWIDRLRP